MAEKAGKITESFAKRTSAVVKWAEGQRVDRRPMRRKSVYPQRTVKVYIATADAAGGKVTVKWCNSAGVGTGDTITLDVLP